jgi:cysteine-rich repeat protein
MTAWRHLVWAVTASATLAVLCPATLCAHGAPPDIGFWGPFPRRTLHCLRMLGRATKRCFLQVLSIERRCRDGALSGMPCDPVQRSEQIQDARQLAQNEVQRACLGGQLTELNFSSFDDAFNDVARGCIDQAAAAISVLYRPALATDTAAAAAGSATRCMVETSARAAKVLRQATRLRSRALELIAVDPLPLLKRSEKLSLLQRAADRVTAARQRAAARIAAVCPAFAAVYGRSIDEVLGLLVPVGDCVVGSVYVQLTVACPCGNGITESGEQCDDGNQVDTDRCTNRCTFRP